MNELRRKVDAAFAKYVRANAELQNTVREQSKILSELSQKAAQFENEYFALRLELTAALDAAK